MPSNNNKELVEDLAKTLQSTTAIMQSLLGEIHDNATTLAVLREKLESLKSKVESLSSTIKDGNGKESLITRFAIVENDMEDLDKKIDHYKSKLDGKVELVRLDKEKIEEYNREKSLGVWKLAAVASPGLIALIIEVIKLLS